MLIILLLWGQFMNTRATCDACVAGWCHDRETLIQGFHVTDQLALDHTNNVLYVQLNSTQNTAFFLDDLKVQLVLASNTSGMTIDQDTQILYMAGYDGAVYEYPYSSNTAKLATIEIYEPNAERLFYKGKLHYTSNHSEGINFISDNGSKYYDDLVNYTITDFVIDKEGDIYFVANGTVYVYNLGTNFVQVVAEKNYVLSTDKYGTAYFGDATENVIHKLNDLNELVAYAVYANGSVDRFVFDNANNIVFYDTTDNCVGTWRNASTKCSVEAPRTKYKINENDFNGCGSAIEDNLLNNLDAVDVVKHCLSSKRGLMGFCECLKQFLHKFVNSASDYT